MADWYVITDAQVDPDAPLTSELAYAWRDNPVAMAEGALGAPRISPIAMQSNLLGHLSSGGSNPTITFTGLDSVSRVWGVFHFGSGVDLQVSWEVTSGSGFITPIGIGTASGSVFGHLDIAAGVFTRMSLTSSSGSSVSFSGSGGPIQSLRLGLSGGGSSNSLGAILFHGGS